MPLFITPIEYVDYLEQLAIHGKYREANSRQAGGKKPEFLAGFYPPRLA
jgi:hypothetical protein